MSDQALILRNDSALTISFTAEAEALKESALQVAALIGQVTNADENARAVEAQGKLAEMRRTVEKARKAAKEPILQFGKEIDSKAAAFVAEIATEEMRVTKLLGDFFALEEAKRRATERAAQLEWERIESERRREVERIAREEALRQAELKRQEAEALRIANEAKSAKAREEAERQAIELRRQQELSAAKTHEQLDAAQERASIAQASVSVPAPVPVRAKGQSVKPDIEITVVDIHKLYRAHPNCVNLEPRLSDIKALIQSGVTVAGVTHKEVFKSQVRSTAPKAIDV